MTSSDRTGTVAWARNQLLIATQIVDNPGGGQLSAQQAIGQARAALVEADRGRWLSVATLLHQAEDHAQQRDFEACREALRRSQEMLSD